MNGVLITEVEFNSLAAEKGLGRGLVITAVNNTPVSNVSEWDGVIGELRRGQPVKIDAVAPSGQTARFFLRAQ